MVNPRVAKRECFSSLADIIRWATYPPPPGSAPGYHDAHHWTPTKARKADVERASAPAALMGDPVSPITGVKRNVHAGSLLTSPATPPISGRPRTTIASTMQ